jgi:hypothetical protein
MVSLRLEGTGQLRSKYTVLLMLEAVKYVQLQTTIFVLRLVDTTPLKCFCIAEQQ